MREWETKWQNHLQINNLDWIKIWENLNNRMHNLRTKSALWEMCHLNFWSSYKAGENCNLCKEADNDGFHILNKCPILIEIIKTFQLHHKYSSKLLISFGLENDQISNFILYHIKTVVFRARFQSFASKEVCKTILIKRCKNRIQTDLQKRLYIYKLKGKVLDFVKTFVQPNPNNDNINHNNGNDNDDNINNDNSDNNNSSNNHNDEGNNEGSIIDNGRDDINIDSSNVGLSGEQLNNNISYNSNNFSNVNNNNYSNSVNNGNNNNHNNNNKFWSVIDNSTIIFHF